MMMFIITNAKMMTTNQAFPSAGDIWQMCLIAHEDKRTHPLEGSSKQSVVYGRYDGEMVLFIVLVFNSKPSRKF